MPVYDIWNLGFKCFISSINVPLSRLDRWKTNPMHTTNTWGQLVLLTTILNHKTCINTSRQVLEKTIFAINAIFTQDNNLSKTKVEGSLQKTNATCSKCKTFLVRSCCIWWTKTEAKARVGRPQTSSSPPVIFIAGRPKAALLFWFFGDFRCGALLFMVIHVIYKYKNR